MTVTHSTTVDSVICALDHSFPPSWAEEWDRVGFVVGEPSAPVSRILLVIDCVPDTVKQAIDVGAQLIVSHHPLLLRGVSSVACTTYKGRIIHQLIRAGIAIYTAHTNADSANPGVSHALAGRLGLVDTHPLHPAKDNPQRGFGLAGTLPHPMPLTAFSHLVAQVLPPTQGGLRVAGDPDRMIEYVAVCGGSGESFLSDAHALGVDAYLTADLRHHPTSECVSEHGPALLDAAHWATERPWLDPLADYLRTSVGVDVIVSDLDTDPWTAHILAESPDRVKEPHT